MYPMYGRDHMSGGSHEKCVGGGSADVASASRAESRRPSEVSPDNVSPVLRREDEDDCEQKAVIDAEMDDAASTSLLMIQGDKDTTIPVKHAYHMNKKADAVGAPVEVMIVRPPRLISPPCFLSSASISGIW